MVYKITFKNYNTTFFIDDLYIDSLLIIANLMVMRWVYKLNQAEKNRNISLNDNNDNLDNLDRDDPLNIRGGDFNLIAKLADEVSKDPGFYLILKNRTIRELEKLLNAKSGSVTVVSFSLFLYATLKSRHTDITIFDTANVNFSTDRIESLLKTGSLAVSIAYTFISRSLIVGALVITCVTGYIARDRFITRLPDHLQRIEIGQDSRYFLEEGDTGEPRFYVDTGNGKDIYIMRTQKTSNDAGVFTDENLFISTDQKTRCFSPSFSNDVTLYSKEIPFGDKKLENTCSAAIPTANDDVIEVPKDTYLMHKPKRVTHIRKSQVKYLKDVKDKHYDGPELTQIHQLQKENRAFKAGKIPREDLNFWPNDEYE